LREKLNLIEKKIVGNMRTVKKGTMGETGYCGLYRTVGETKDHEKNGMNY
jgi:hypothetical protein